MAPALSNLIPALFVGALALLSHWAKKDKLAEISLLVVVVSISLVVTAVGALLLVVGFAEAVPDEVVPTPVTLAAGSAVTVAGLAGLALCVPPLLSVIGRAERGFWSDPPVFFALWVFVMVLALSLVGFVAFLGTDAGTLAAGVGGRLSPADAILQQIPLLIVAVLGVGLGVRRTPGEVVRRLGYGPLSVAQLGVCVLFIAVALALSAAADRLFAALQPDLYERVGDLSSQLFSTQGMGLGAVLLFGAALGLGAALGEESLFRGAVQPALGIVPASLLFTALHIQYGPSVSLGYVLLLAFGLGLLRKRINTSASFVAHAGYNFASVVLAYLLGGGF